MNRTCVELQIEHKTYLIMSTWKIKWSIYLTIYNAGFHIADTWESNLRQRSYRLVLDGPSFSCFNIIEIIYKQFCTETRCSPRWSFIWLEFFYLLCKMHSCSCLLYRYISCLHLHNYLGFHHFWLQNCITMMSMSIFLSIMSNAVMY
jgi:hypothetical protein